MTAEYAQPYEAPISLDAGRMLGARPMRSTLWTFGAVVGELPVVISGVMLAFLAFGRAGNEDLTAFVNTLFLILLLPSVLWLLTCLLMSHDLGQRPAEYWFKAWVRHRRLPKRLEGQRLVQHHSRLSDAPRGCVEIITNTNLRMADEESLASTIKRLGAFFNGLRFPVQVVVRAWPDGNLIQRRWFIAVTASTQPILDAYIESICSGLLRAGLRGHALNGELYDTLNACWTARPFRDRIGPAVMTRMARSVVVDDEHVRGFVLTRMPRIVDPNWLAPLLDGDLATDFSAWIEPTDNADELEYLAARIFEWQTAQIQNVNQGYSPNPDIDDQISDAKRTRLLVRRGELRVFRTTIGFVVRGTSHAQMVEREGLLRDMLREKVGHEALIPLDLEHDRVPLMAVPCGQPPVEYPLRVVTPALARSYPFSNSSVHHPRGIEIGTSVGSKHANQINLFSLTNPHAVVLGTTGAGKSYWVKVFLWRLMRANPHLSVVIIQSEKNDYSALAEAMDDAQVVRVSTLAELPGLIDPAYYTASEALKTYRQLQLYDLTGMRPDERGKAIAFLLPAIEKSAAWAPGYQYGVVVIDELGIVIESPEAAMAIESAYRRFRSIPMTDNPKHVNRRAMIGISQMPSDLLNHPRGSKLSKLALTHVYFRQDSAELHDVARKLRLSPDEERFLDEQCEEGTGLLVVDKARIGFHLDATDFEKTFATT